MARSTRNAPFCWQEKKVNRVLRKLFTGSTMSKMLLLYATITEIDSDFNNKDIKYYTKTISTYSGLSKDFIPTGIKELEKIGVVEIEEERTCGKYKGKMIIFTPEKIKETPRKSVSVKPLNGESLKGKQEPSEDSIIIEDNPLKEDSSYIGMPDGKTEKNSEVEVLGKQINDVLSEFTKGDRMFAGPSVFGRKTYRDASEELIKKFGFNAVIELIKLSIGIRNKLYAPVITNPLELKKNMPKLESYLKKESEKQNNITGKTIIGTDFSKK